MKQTVLILLCAAVALFSCTKAPIGPVQETASAPVRFTLSATHPGGEATRAVKTGWETGDVIFVFFEEFPAPRYLKMTYDGTDWTETQMNGAVEETLGLSDGDEVHMRAVYLPFGSGCAVLDDGGGNFVFDKPGLAESYYLTATLACAVEGGEVEGCFAMKVPEGYVQFSSELTGSFNSDGTSVENTQDGIKLREGGTELGTFCSELREPHLTPQGIASIDAGGNITHTSVIHGAPLRGYFYARDGETPCVLYSGILEDSARNTEVDYHFTCRSRFFEGHRVASDFYQRKSFSARKLYRSEQEGRALKFPSTGWETITDHLPVDLGCDIDLGGGEKRRIYWSSRNLGASRDLPADNTGEARQATWGDYYAWGETEPYYKPGYAYENPIENWEHWQTGKDVGYHWYSYSLDNSAAHDGSSFSRYTGSDHAVLLKEDDAASAKLQGLWRMPSIAEWAVLADNTRFTWSWDEDNLGMIVTGNAPGFEDSSIFLPAAGYRQEKALISTGTPPYGFYWSATLSPAYSVSGLGLRFYYGSQCWVDEYMSGRFFGQTVRPVSD